MGGESRAWKESKAVRRNESEATTGTHGKSRHRAAGHGRNMSLSPARKGAVLEHLGKQQGGKVSMCQFSTALASCA